MKAKVLFFICFLFVFSTVIFSQNRLTPFLTVAYSDGFLNYIHYQGNNTQEGVLYEYGGTYTAKGNNIISADLFIPTGLLEAKRFNMYGLRLCYLNITTQDPVAFQKTFTKHIYGGGFWLGGFNEYFSYAWIIDVIRADATHLGTGALLTVRVTKEIDFVFQYRSIHPAQTGKERSPEVDEQLSFPKTLRHGYMITAGIGFNPLAIFRR